MSVNPNYRRGGVGAKLVQACATVNLIMLQRVMYTYQIYRIGEKKKMYYGKKKDKWGKSAWVRRM